MCRAQALGCSDALVGAARGHPDIGDDHIRERAVDCREKRVEIFTHRGKLNAILGLE